MAGKIVLASELSKSKAEILLDRLARGESVSTEERLNVVQEILAFSPRDWSDDPELWLLYRVVFNKSGESG